MSEEITTYKGKMKYSGLYDFKDYYEFIFDHLMDEGFDVYENKYYEKNMGDGKNVEIIWDAVKPISDYFVMKINIYWIILGMKSVEILYP